MTIFSTLFRLAASSPDLLRPMSGTECRGLLTAGMARREDNFLSLLRDGVYSRDSSPYKKLLQAARISYPDISELVSKEGVEEALRQLYETGVYVTLEEFKGIRPLRRLGLDIEVGERDFDNPLGERHLETYTGGSSGWRRRALVDLGEWQRQAAAHYFFREAYQVSDRPIGLWQPFCPGSVGPKNNFVYCKLGCAPEQWFSQVPTKLNRGSLPYHAFRTYLTLAGRRWGLSQPPLRYVPLGQAHRVASWLGKMKEAGHPAYLDTNCGSAMRVCAAAESEGTDISGTFFRLGSEPYTEAKARRLADSACSGAVQYMTTEVGALGIACGDPAAVDDVHLMEDSVALLVQSKLCGVGRGTVDAFFVTSLRSSSPKLLINVEQGDYGVIQRRDCGCPFSEMGFKTHLHSIRSYEKLTSEGNHFLGKHLITLVEEVLPTTFGGGPTDYQLVEREEEGWTRVDLLIHPHLGPVDGDKVIRAVLDFLGSCGEGEKLMADIWHSGNTLQVIRREPYQTPGAKIMPLHHAR